jgi:hypothetical protein
MSARVEHRGAHPKRGRDRPHRWARDNNASSRSNIHKTPPFLRPAVGVPRFEPTLERTGPARSWLQISKSRGVTGQPQKKATGPSPRCTAFVRGQRDTSGAAVLLFVPVWRLMIYIESGALDVARHFFAGASPCRTNRQFPSARETTPPRDSLAVVRAVEASTPTDRLPPRRQHLQSQSRQLEQPATHDHHRRPRP